VIDVPADRIEDMLKRIDETQTLSFLRRLGEESPDQVDLWVGKRWEFATVILLATIDGKELAETAIFGIQSVEAYYIDNYLSSQWKQVLKEKLERHGYGRLAWVRNSTD